MEKDLKQTNPEEDQGNPRRRQLNLKIWKLTGMSQLRHSTN